MQHRWVHLIISSKRTTTVSMVSQMKSVQHLFLKFRYFSFLYLGDVLIHNGWVIHGASGNQSTSRRRRGYVTRWLGDDITFDGRPGTIYPGWQKIGYDCGLKEGDPMDCDQHPVVYRKNS